MADQIQRYRPAALRKVKQFLVRTDTAHIYVPGHKLPARVEFTRPRWWPVSLMIIGAVVGTAFLMTRLLAPSSVTVPASPLPQRMGACVPDDLMLVASKIKDRLSVFVDDRLVATIHHGESVNLDGSRDRTFKGPGWGQVNLTPHVPDGTHRIRFVAVHDQGINAGAGAELRHNGRAIHVVAYPYGPQDRHGTFVDQTIQITMNKCMKEQDDERTAAER